MERGGSRGEEGGRGAAEGEALVRWWWAFGAGACCAGSASGSSESWRSGPYDALREISRVRSSSRSRLSSWPMATGSPNWPPW